jgi:nucleoside-diphosphate-sugar epimerase
MIFVTGGTGMVGAHLLYDLAYKGEKVRALKRPGSNFAKTEKIFSFYNTDYKSLLQNIEWVEGDILDKECLYQHLIGIDQIYHSAAMVSFDPKDRQQMLENNSQGTANLVDVALSLQVPRFCHVSSIAAIGTPPEGIEANEFHPWRNSTNHSAYAESKYVSEMEVWRATINGLNAVIVNPSVILGPGDWKSSGSPALFFNVWKGMKFYTKGGTGFVNVKDVTSAMWLLMQDDVWEKVKNQRFILNSGNISFRNLFSQIAVALNVDPPKYFAGNVLLKLAGLLSRFQGFLTGSRPKLSKETIRSANKISYYDGSKICGEIGFSYTPVEDSIRNISEIYLKDHVR